MQSYAITSADGHTWFVNADRARANRHGRLVFRRWYGLVVAGVDAGQWTRFVRGLTLEDIQAAKQRAKEQAR